MSVLRSEDVTGLGTVDLRAVAGTARFVGLMVSPLVFIMAVTYLHDPAVFWARLETLGWAFGMLAATTPLGVAVSRLVTKWDARHNRV